MNQEKQDFQKKYNFNSNLYMYYDVQNISNIWLLWNKTKTLISFVKIYHIVTECQFFPPFIQSKSISTVYQLL